MSLERLENVQGITGEAGATGASGAVHARFRPGFYYGPDGAPLGGSTGTVTNGTCHYCPVYIPVAISIDRLGFWLTTNGGAGSLQRLGIYSDNGSGKPGNVLLDAGTVATDTGSGALVTITVSQALSAGTWYWLTIAQQGAPSPTADIRRHSGLMPYPILQYAGSGTSFIPQNVWSSTGITGAFANNPTTTLSGSFMHIVIFRTV